MSSIEKHYIVETFHIHILIFNINSKFIELIFIEYEWIFWHLLCVKRIIRVFIYRLTILKVLLILVS